MEQLLLSAAQLVAQLPAVQCKKHNIHPQLLVSVAPPHCCNGSCLLPHAQAHDEDESNMPSASVKVLRQLAYPASRHTATWRLLTVTMSGDEPIYAAVTAAAQRAQSVSAGHGLCMAQLETVRTTRVVTQPQLDAAKQQVRVWRGAVMPACLHMPW